MALSVDATSHATALDASATGASVGITWNHTCGASANKLVISVGTGANASGADGRNIASVTYNGVACSQVVEQDDGNFEHVEIWELNDPPTGSSFAILVKTIIDTVAGSGLQIAAGAISFIGASATNRATNGATNTSANPSVAVTSESGDICVDAYASDLGSSGTSTPDGTVIWEDENVGGGDSDFGSQRVTASGSSTTLSWTAISDKWAQCAVAIKAAGGTPATQIPFVGSFGRSGGRVRNRYPL